ncbi:MAG: hypothetical protein WDN28_07110 [Chthoniobacter sp.]
MGLMRAKGDHHIEVARRRADLVEEPREEDAERAGAGRVRAR